MTPPREMDPPPRPPDAPRHWQLRLLGGTLPALVLGLGASALANQLTFAAWGLATAGAWVALQSHAVHASWSGRRTLGGSCLLAAVAVAALGLLVLAHQEILDLGFRALLPTLYHPLMVRPATTLVASALLGLLGGFFLLRGREIRP